MKIKRKNTPATKNNRQLLIKTGYELFFKFESVKYVAVNFDILL